MRYQIHCKSGEGGLFNILALTVREQSQEASNFSAPEQTLADIITEGTTSKARNLERGAPASRPRQRHRKPERPGKPSPGSFRRRRSGD